MNNFVSTYCNQGRRKEAEALEVPGEINICQQSVYGKKCNKEQTRCLKCHVYGHLLDDCQQH